MPDSSEFYRQLLRESANDARQSKARGEAATGLASSLKKLGEHAFVNGHILGTDRRDGHSPFGHGDDAVVAVSRLLLIASELISGSADLITDGRVYAGSALLRQIVEVEYLLWAFSENHENAARWLRSDKRERMKFFSPRKLREASNGVIREADYAYHCEMGGHPVPNSSYFLQNENNVGQLILSDCIGHGERIAKLASKFLMGRDVLLETDLVVQEIMKLTEDWRNCDNLTKLPPPPIPPENNMGRVH